MPTEPDRDIACLLVHGLNGSPYDFDDVAMQLRALGYPTHQLLLPGHDVLARVAVRYGWDDWSLALHESFNELARRHRRVVVIGHSMGGTLGLHVAACDDRVAGIVSLCAPVSLHAGLRPIVRMGKVVLPFVPIMREDIRDFLFGEEADDFFV